MKNILAVIKKEFARFFKDKRMVITTLILPALMIYFLYSFMGDGMTNMMMPDNTHVYNVGIYNESEIMTGAIDSFGSEDFKINIISEKGSYGKVNEFVTRVEPTKTIEEAVEAIKNREIDIVIVFPENFDSRVLGEEMVVGNNIEIYFDSTDKYSSNAYEIYSGIFQSVEDTLINKFDINTPLTDKQYDVASEKDKTGQIFAMMLPMLLIIFLFSGCMSVAPESIAGEKERGTIATLLVTPIKRKELAIGKIVSLSVIGFLSGLSSFVGTMLSLPKMMGDSVELSANVYGITDYIYTLLVIVVTVLMLTALIGIISAFSKSVKEASTYLAPLMIIVTLLGVSSMMFEGGQVNTVMYLIPVFNSIQVFNAIFSFNFNMVNLLITLVSNAIYSAILIYVLTGMFSNEKIMFNK